jgi:two-component system competent response regulator ComA
MKRVVKAIVIDDHPLMAQATQQLLGQIDSLEVAGIAHSGQEALELAAAVQPDLIFLDYQLPDQSGTKVAEHLKRQLPKAHIVIFTGVDISDLLPHLLSNQISGIVSKSANEATIKHIVACVLDNHVVLPHSLLNKLLKTPLKQEIEIPLTDEECKLMQMVVRGETYEKIAEHMYVSKRSVDNYLRKIYEKMGVQTRIQAIERFVQSNQYTEQG